MKGPEALLQHQEETLLEAWMANLDVADTRMSTLLTEGERRRYSKRILAGLLKAISAGDSRNIEGTDFKDVRDALGDVSRNFAERGLSPSETATYVFSLKEPLFELYRGAYEGDELSNRTWEINKLVDKLGLFTFEAYARAREGLIKSQAQAISELSTPVIKIWEGILTVPLVGVVDSARAKEIMERLLEAVVEQAAEVVIIDITGVAVVDTQVANRLMKTVDAVRLLGTQSIITGINPVIAQTLVQLGVDLSQLTTKASLHAGLQQAFRQLRISVGERKR